MKSYTAFLFLALAACDAKIEVSTKQYIPKTVRGTVVKVDYKHHWVDNEEFRMAVDTDSGRIVIELVSDYEAKRAQVVFVAGDVVEFDANAVDTFDGVYRPWHAADVRVVMKGQK